MPTKQKTKTTKAPRNKALTPAQAKKLEAKRIGAFARSTASAGLPLEATKLMLSAGYFPTPRQLEFHVNCFRCDDPKFLPMDIGYGGTRGPGKTHAAFMQIVLDCVRVDGLKVLFLRKVGKYASEGIDDLRRKTLSRVKHKAVRSLINFPNDSRITVGSYRYENDIDNYLSLEYDVILIEQAEQLTKDKIESIATVCRSSKPNWRARMYYTFNPGGVGHQYLKTTFIMPWRAGQEVTTRFVNAAPADNPFLSDEYKKKVLGKLVGWKREAWLKGNWDIAAGQFFTNFRFDRNTFDTRKDFPWIFEDVADPAEATPGHDGKRRRPPREAAIWAALDFGFTHYTAVYLFVEYEGIRYVLAEHCERQKLVEHHATEIKAMLERCGLGLNDLWTFVAGTDVFAQKGDQYGETIADQYRKHGIYLEAANVDRVTGADKIREWFGDEDNEPPLPARLKISRDCVKLLECLPALIINPKKPDDVLKQDIDDDGNGGDDPYDALRYGHMVKASGGVYF